MSSLSPDSSASAERPSTSSAAASGRPTGPDGGEQRASNAGQERIHPKKVRTLHLQKFKDAGQKFGMLTAYDAEMASIFNDVGIEVLLVGDSASNVMMGRSTTLPITVDELLVFAKSVVNGAQRSLIVVDLPFGSYEASPQQAVETAVRFMKEAGVHAVKVEGDASISGHIQALVSAGIPVMAHVGFTPQSEHALGGYRVQGRGETSDRLLQDALAAQEAGAFCVLMEMVPAAVAAEVDAALHVPTVGIGAGSSTTGQVLVWQDVLGLGSGRSPRFVKQYADLRGVVTDAVAQYHHDVISGEFPAQEHTF